MKIKFVLLMLTSILIIASPVYSQPTPDAVISSDNPADAALAQLLAHRFGVPAIETPWGTFSDDSIDKLNSLNSSSVYIVGGEAAVPGIEVLSDQGIQVIKRFNGTDRYQTSALVGREWGNSSSIVVVSGYDEEGIKDAVVRAQEVGAPVLLVPRDHIPDETSETITALSPENAVLIPSPEMIQNFILIDLSSLNTSVQTIQTNHQNKTRDIIKSAELIINDSETQNFTTQINNKSQETAEKLIDEAKTGLITAQEMFEERMYHLAFNLAVFAKFKAENSIKIKQGIIEITSDEPQIEEEPIAKEEDENIMISQVLLNPLDYDGKEAVIKGQVEEAIEVGGKAFVKLFDGTGRIIATFPADRDYMLSKGFIFMADPEIVGQTVVVNGTVNINVPLGGGEGHGAFAYLLEANTITLATE